MKSLSKSFPMLREFAELVPIIDCHDHTLKPGPKLLDPIHALVEGYFATDLWSVSSDNDIQYVLNSKIAWRERWPLFKKLWDLAKHTGYGQVVQSVLREFYSIDELTLEEMEKIEKKMPDLENPDVFDGILEKANIAVRISDIFHDGSTLDAITVPGTENTLALPPRGRMVISLPHFHNICSYEDIRSRMARLNRTCTTTLDDYVAGCYEIFQQMKALGAVAFKDQSAYSRSISYSNPTRAEAEKVFNWIVSDPRRKASYPDQVKPLDDYLFHRFMNMAAEMDLPVQLHTGLLAGIRHDVSKANAILLLPVLELHRDVKFDLFHGNWPYSDEWLFLGKNYPNVYLNFCWVNTIDPIYSQRIFQQAVSSLPHGKIFGYGSDYGGYATHAWAHSQLSKDNIAIALSALVDMEYLTMNDSKEIIKAWLYDNPNRFFKLGLPELKLS